jgi:putative membrane protein
MTTNTVQIRGSQYAVPRMQYYDILNFANAMVVDYQNYQNILINFSQKSGVSPELSATAREIEARGNEVLEEMKALKGMALEKRYIEAQIELHLKTLDTIDQLFLPNVYNQELRNLINGLRPTVQNRLEWAFRIQKAYGGIARAL